MTQHDERVLRADLHVHSTHSGYSRHLRFLHARECYSRAASVYATAKARGMDLVTITDHDTIDGCLEFLEARPDAADFFISEEIECRFPDVDLKVHIGAYDISERIHREIQPLRRNLFEAAAYLRSQGVFYAVNHPFFFFKGQLPLDAYLETLVGLFPAMEIRNGTMLMQQNVLAEAIVSQRASHAGTLASIGGSDSHTLAGVGTTYTIAPGTTREDFLRSLRAGRASVGGRHGSAWREAREIYGVVARYWGSLLGAGPQEFSWRRRALGLAFSTASMPFQFIPLLTAILHKRDESLRVARYRHEWHASHSQHGSRLVGMPADFRVPSGASIQPPQ
jgi:predicted metal-dependent phosphoesterase TrpH